MTLNGLVGNLITLGFLTSHVCVYAQTSGPEESSFQISQESEQSADSLSLNNTHVNNQPKKENSGFDARQLILPGALIAVGTYGVYNCAFREFTYDIKTEMDRIRGDCYFHADDYLQYLPALTYLTFGSIGIKSKHSFKERVVVEATAYIMMAALTNLGKFAFGEKRPDSDARNTFPSGHTATVFTGAELMREEYGLGLGIAAYTVATGVAFLRLYNGRHWLNDVIAGAGVGILCARIGYWMLPLYQRWFKWNKPSQDIMVISPAYNPSETSLSINLTYTF